MNPATRTGTRHRLGLAAIVKNEGRYLIEWLVHHRAVGVEHFYIANNESTDDTAQRLEALSQILPITWFNVPTSTANETGAQLPAYETIMRRYGGEVDWMAFLDADEYLWPETHPDSIVRLIEDMQQAHPDIGALALNWATYGSSRLVNEEDRLVTERFQHHAHQQHPVNHQFKSIIRPEAFAGFTCPHNSHLKPGYRYLHADGSEKRPCFIDGQSNSSHSGDVCWTRFRVNHYVIKSYAEFHLRKAARGRAFLLGTLDDDFFVAHDNNEQLSEPPPGYLTALTAECQSVAERIGQPDPFSALPGPDALPQHPARSAHLPVVGNVDALERQGDQIRITGWVLLWKTEPANGFRVTVNGQTAAVEHWQAVTRADVLNHYPGANPQCGFDMRIASPGPCDAKDIVVCVQLPDDHTTQPVAPGAFAHTFRTNSQTTPA